MKRVTFLFIATLIIAGCTQKSITVNETSLHGTKSTELQMLMHKFDNLIYQHYESELDRDRRRIDYTKDMIDIVDELVTNSKKLKTLPPKNLTQQQIQGFLMFANTLENKSKELKLMVNSYQIEKINPIITELNNVCVSCHATIR